ncbi:hypothetical protein SSP35_24_00090 [Streptomyces sp. NBRC 110611]|uniref:DUF4097 family beta strand repeat-containing protein n=1 Tax=Streptomyces sp. NBRC 110611 TaxID=1621259 RepID=UPI000834311B|nr:DUF4097 family beta strand repeat-containing protein [Streptomyces sp. NBRC 110611]GAU70904.1 hypothetical protein SSP35_24_00090 [Streptomyces sp. NBRC 110611]
MARLRASHLVLPCAALTALLTGCSLSGYGPMKEAQRTYTVDGKVTTLAATTHGGDIEVVPIDAGGSVKVTEKYRYNDRKPAPSHDVKDGRLTLKAEECGMGRKCEVGYRVLLPRDASVELRTSGGDITVRGTAGRIDADTSGGDITVADSTARKGKVRTSGGDVDITLSEAPDDFQGRTSGGNVTVRLPKGSYAVDASTSGGTSKVSVPTDPRSAHKVTARTSGGDVRVQPS